VFSREEFAGRAFERVDVRTARASTSRSVARIDRDVNEWKYFYSFSSDVVSVVSVVARGVRRGSSERSIGHTIDRSVDRGTDAPNFLCLIWSSRSFFDES
jgi:hypothetical protein